MLDHDAFGGNGDIYRQNILDHNASPKNKRRMEHATWSRRNRNMSCGDDIEIFVLERDGAVADISFDGVGCAVSQAAASMLTEEAKGRTVESIAAMGKDDVMRMLGIDVGPSRIKCALLALSTLQKGIASREDRH